MRLTRQLRPRHPDIEHLRTGIDRVPIPGGKFGRYAFSLPDKLAHCCSDDHPSGIRQLSWGKRS
jgi:hypothetical protein